MSTKPNPAEEFLIYRNDPVTGQSVWILEHNNTTGENIYKSPPEGFTYQVINGYQLTVRDLYRRFVLETSPNGNQRVLLIANPYAEAEVGRNVQLKGGVLVTTPVVSFAKTGDAIVDDSGIGLGTALVELVQYTLNPHESLPKPTPVAAQQLAAMDLGLMSAIWEQTAAINYFMPNYIKWQQQVALQQQAAWQAQNFNLQFLSYLESQKATAAFMAAGDAADPKHARERAAAKIDYITQQLQEMHTAAATPAPKSPPHGTEMLFSAAPPAVNLQQELARQAEIEHGLTQITALAETPEFQQISDLTKFIRLIERISAIYGGLNIRPTEEVDLFSRLQPLVESLFLELKVIVAGLNYLGAATNIPPQLKAQLQSAVLNFMLSNYRADDFVGDLARNFVDRVAPQITCPANLRPGYDLLIDRLKRMLVAAPGQPSAPSAAQPAPTAAAPAPVVAQPPPSAKSGGGGGPKSHKSKAAKSAVTKEKEDDAYLNSLPKYDELQLTPFEQAIQILDSGISGDNMARQLYALLSKHPEIIKQVSQDNQTLLMRVLAKNLRDLKLIRLLINNSERSIAHKDNDGNTIMHYWANSTPHTDSVFEIFKLLYPEFTKYLKENKFPSLLRHPSTLNYTPIINFLKNNAGETFLHVFANRFIPNDLELIAKYFSELFDINEAREDRYLRLSSPLLIAKDRAGNNFFMLLEKMRPRRNALGIADPKSKGNQRKINFLHHSVAFAYNTLAATLTPALTSRKISIRLPQYGEDFINFFNFQPTNPEDPLRKRLVEAKPGYIEDLVQILRYRAEFMGVTYGSEFDTSKFFKLPQTDPETRQIFLTEAKVVGELLITLRDAPNSPVDRIIHDWLTVESKPEHFPSLLAFMMDYLGRFMFNLETDPDKIEPCLDLVSRIVDQLIADPDFGKLRAQQKLWHTEIVGFLYPGLCILINANYFEGKDELFARTLQTLEKCIAQIAAFDDASYYTAEAGGGNMLHKILTYYTRYEELNAKHRELLSRLVSAIERKEPGAVARLLVQTNAAGQLPGDEIDPKIKAQVMDILQQRSSRKLAAS